jgi:hypothetical protein
MSKESVFQQQARMQSAQLEQNQAIMAQNAQQIAMMKKSLNDKERSKLLVQVLFDATKILKRIKTIALNHPTHGYLLSQLELEFFDDNGINVQNITTGDEKVRLMEMCDELEDLQADDAEPEDSIEWFESITKAAELHRRILEMNSNELEKGSEDSEDSEDSEPLKSQPKKVVSLESKLIGSNIDELERAKEDWCQSKIQEAEQEYKDTFTNNISTLGGILKTLIFGIFSCGLWFLAVPYLIISAPKDRDAKIEQAKSNLAAFKTLCQTYRDWLSSEHGLHALEEFFKENPESWSLVKERYF